MSHGDSTYPALLSMVRSALAHLFDYAYLENHPLAALVDAARGLDEVTRAQKLRRLLLDYIEEIKPQEAGEPASAVDRVHAILTYRYVDGLPMDVVARNLGLGERQAYRAQEKGVKAVAGLLQDRMRREGLTLAPRFSAHEREGATLPVSTAEPLDPAQAEVARLRQSAPIELLNLGDLVEGVLELLAPLGERTGIHLTLQTSAPWPKVSAHRVMLRQALVNLLTQALDDAVQGDLAITLYTDPAAAYIEIAEQVAPDRAQPTEAAKEIDLAMAQALLEAQGARLEASRREGRWMMRVVLSTATHATILAIDDNADLVALLQRYLAGHQVQVVGAGAAEQALQLARELRPRLITLDVMMPDQDGWEILQRLKREPATRDIPVIICSVMHEQRLAEAMGASDYIAKPVSQESLLETLMRWLGPLPLAA